MKTDEKSGVDREGGQQPCGTGSNAPFGGKRHTGGKKGVRPPSQYLKDMRYVYENEAPADGESRGQKTLRSMYDKDPDKFMDRLQKAESEHRRGAAKSAPQGGSESGNPTRPSADEPDEGVERCLELVKKALEDKPWLQ